MAVYSDYANVEGPEGPKRVRATYTSGDVFRLLGTETELGRGLQPRDEEPGAPGVVVASHRYWRDHFGGDVGAVGRTISVWGHERTLVGVLPPRFEIAKSLAATGVGSAGGTDLWMPLSLRERRHERDTRWLTALGKTELGAEKGSVQGAVTSLSRRVAASHRGDLRAGARARPRGRDGLHPREQPGCDDRRRGLRSPALRVSAELQPMAVGGRLPSVRPSRLSRRGCRARCLLGAAARRWAVRTISRRRRASSAEAAVARLT